MGKRFAESAFCGFLIWGICASMAMTVCTLADAILIGNLVGDEGLAVTNLSTPVFLFYALVGITLGVGANVSIGRELGAAHISEADVLFHQVLTGGMLLGLLLAVLGLLFRNPLLWFLGARGSLTVGAKQYLTVVLASAPFFILYPILSCSVRTDGEPRLAAAASAVVIGINLSLDILFMKYLHWGIGGASASLCIAELSGAAVLLLHFQNRNALLTLKMTWLPWKDLAAFSKSGFGVGSSYIFQGIVLVVFNRLLMQWGGENRVQWVAVFGVIYTISTVPFGIFDGASGALATVCAILTGERDSSGILSVARFCSIFLLLSGIALWTACGIWAEHMGAWFGITEPAARLLSARAIRIYGVSIIFCGFNIGATAFWQSIGRNRKAALLSILRNLCLMLLIGAFLIPRYGILGAAFSFVATEILGFLFLVFTECHSSSRLFVIRNDSSSGRTFENVYPIYQGSVERIGEDLDTLCKDWNIGSGPDFLLHLIAEELLLNICKYGLSSRKKKRYIAIKILQEPDGYMVRIRDNVASYNPFSGAGDAIDCGILRLISRKALSCSYQRKLVFNYLYLIIGDK